MIILMKKIKKLLKVLTSLGKILTLLPRFSLSTIYKSFVGPHLDYRDVNNDQLVK